VTLAVGAGADVMQRIASPMIGGLVTLLLMTLMIIPVAYVSARAIAIRLRARKLGKIGEPP
jgi:Cu(I)/Ag(I) efflux system membrane protein CusA/SilA